MRGIILSAISVILFHDMVQAQRMPEITDKDGNSDFIFYLSSVVYDASSLYHIKCFALSDVINIFDDIPELQDTIYTPLLKSNIDIECRENTIGDIDVFRTDTFIVSVVNPFVCGDRILLRNFWPERPDLLHVFPYFEVYAFDQKNHRVNVDSVEKIEFYKSLSEINHSNLESVELEIDKSMHMRQRLHRHIACYNHINSQFGLLCSCDAAIDHDDESLIRQLCQDFCAHNGCSRISFEMFSWHKKAVSEFHEVLLSYFPRLNLPLIIVDSRVESQKTMKQVPYLEIGLLRHYFSCIIDVDNETFLPIGFFRIDDYFVTIIKRKTHRDIAVQTFDSLGKSISCVFLKEDMCENSFVIRNDGHVFLMCKDCSERSYSIGPNGSITIFSEK